MEPQPRAQSDPQPLPRAARGMLLVHCISIPLLLSAFGIVFIGTPHGDAVSSSGENRRLAQFPSFTFASLSNGVYTRAIEDYVADRFPARSVLVSAAFTMQGWRGIHVDGRVVPIDGSKAGFEDAGPLVGAVNPDSGKDASAPAEPNSEDGPVKDGDKMEAVTSASSVNATAVSATANSVNGIVIHDKRGLMLFGAGTRSAQNFAKVANFWAETVAAPANHPPLTVTVVVTPTAGYFYLPRTNQSRAASEAAFLEDLRDALAPGVRYADVLAEMQGHTDESLFFRADHHWTGLGAYYAYRAWAKAAGVEPVPLSAMTKHVAPGNAGSLWNLTHAPELRDADPHSEFWIPPVQELKTVRFDGDEQKTPKPHHFFAEKQTGYYVFLGGDYPLLAAETSAGTGKKVLVIKNSYGNAFAPYLLSHFDTVVVADYRYLKRGIREIVSTFGITDIVLVNATITAASGAHQARIKQVAQGSATAWKTEDERRREKAVEDAAKAADKTKSEAKTDPKADAKTDAKSDTKGEPVEQ